MQLYFNLIYMPLYDYTVAQTSPYQRLQKECIGKLRFDGSESLLCVGVGTGSGVDAAPSSPFARGPIDGFVAACLIGSSSPLPLCVTATCPAETVRMSTFAVRSMPKRW